MANLFFSKLVYPNWNRVVIPSIKGFEAEKDLTLKSYWAKSDWIG